MSDATEAAFRRAIATDPLAALPRLASADYLEEEGQAEQAESVRRLVALKLELVRVPAGPSRFATRPAPQGLPRFTCFWMGAPDSVERADDNEKPQHHVTITRDFTIGKYPVTQGQWRAVMGSNPSHFSREGYGRGRVEGLSDEEVDRLPVETVWLEEVRVFLGALNGREEAGGGLVYRLPSEAEWEYACRGGAVSREDCSHRYYFDRPIEELTPEIANYGVNVDRTPVGMYPGNRLGVYDMHGNVWEWCRDASDERAYGDGAPRTDPSSEGGSNRVNRGGSWNNLGEFCTASLRDGDGPTIADRDLGFRTLAVPASQE